MFDMKKMIKISANLKLPSDRRNHILKIVVSFSLLLFFAFTFTGSNPPSNWTQQFLPSLGTQQINDMTFIDSLTGFIVTSINSNPDSAKILKTTNGGNNWNIVFSQTPRRFMQIKFINNTTGYVSGGTGSGTPYIYKTTNQGINWNTIPGATLGTSLWEGISVLNEDTIWVVDHNSFNGGVYRTTNGGVNWTQQLSAGIYNPTNIYFYNKNLGFAANWQGGRLYRTTNAGENWVQVLNEGFQDMHFTDSLTGWKSLPAPDSSMKKTTNGGLNWFKQALPYGGSPNILFGNMKKFSAINKDTIWGCGGFILYPNNRVKAALYHTTNGGSNWLYQVPDTNINKAYYYIDFTNKNNGWAYDFASGGIHTTAGGDTTFLTKIGETISEIPKLYSLSQNYPNPFNPTTKINYELRITNYVSLKILDINGREISTLVNQRQNAGNYSIEFNGSGLSSGIYFYTLQTEDFKDTKKMILVK